MSDRQCPRCSSGTMRAYGVPTVDADGDETARLRCAGCGASTFEVHPSAKKLASRPFVGDSHRETFDEALQRASDSFRRLTDAIGAAAGRMDLLDHAERRDRAVQIWCRHYAETEAFDRRLFHRVGPDGCAVPIEPDDRISSSKNAGRSSEKARDDCRALGLSWSQINEARNLAGSMSIDEASRIAGVSLPPLGGCE